MPFNLLPSGSSQQQTDESNARAIAAKINAGAPVSPTDVRWLYSKGYGGMVQSSPYASNKASPYTSMVGMSFVRSPTPAPSPTLRPTPTPTPSPARDTLKWGTTDIKAEQLKLLASKYDLPPTPTGYGVSSFEETGTGLSIQYKLVDVEAAIKAGTVSSEFTSAYRTSQAKTAQNTAAWSLLGYSQYGGMYEAPDVPSGFKISKVTEGGAGLNIEFELTSETKARAESIGQNYLSGTAQDIRNIAWLSRDFPDYLEGLQAAKASGKRADVIGANLLSGKAQNIGEVAWLSKTYPEYMEQLQTAKASGRRAEVVGANILSGKAQNISEVAWLSKNFPDYMENLQASRVSGKRAQIIGGNLLSGTGQDIREVAWLSKNFPDYMEQIQTSKASGRRAETIGANLLSGKAQNISEVAWLSKNYPDYMESLQTTKVEGRRAEGIGSKLLLGTAQDIRDVAWLSRDFPNYMEQIQTSRASVKRAEVIGGDYLAGTAQDIKNIAWLSKNYPDYLESLSVAKASSQASLKETTLANAATKRSTDFYTSIGYPEFAGKYEPFELPRNAVLVSLREVYPSAGTIGRRGAGGTDADLTLTSRLEAMYSWPTHSDAYTQNRVVPTPAKTTLEQIGDWLSGTVSVGGPPSFTVIGGKQTFPDYGVKLTRGEALTAIVALNLPFAAPAALPFLGLSSTGIMASAGVSVGVSEVASLITSGKHISPSQAISSALIGEALTIGSSAVLKGASKIPKIGPIFTRSITESFAASGLRGAATSVASRAAIFSAFGAGTGYALSGGDVKQAVIGAISGAAFSAGGDIFKYGVERGFIPVPKYGSVKVPFEIEGEEGVFYTKEPTWRGLYLSRGEKASALVGKFSDFPESMGSVDDELSGVGARIASHGASGEELGWKPVSNIESEVTLRTMSRMGYGPQVIEDIGSFRQIMSTTQYTKSKFIEDLLPSETGTLGEKGVSSLKDYVLRNKGQVEELYGSFGTRPQLSTEFEYTLTTPSGDVISALRTPADIDIQLGTTDLGKASKFASDLSKVLGRAGETVRISSESPTMIEANVGGKWAHAVDIHYAGEPNADLISAGGWGYKYTRPTTQIEKLPVMSLSEQGLRKGANSILGFNYDMSIGPVAHRLKDIPDFFQAQETLLESARPSGKVAEAQSLLSGLAERYNVSLGNTMPYRQQYIVSKSTMFQSTPIMVSSQAFTLNKAGYTSQTVSMKMTPSSMPSITVPSIAKLTTSPSVKIGSVKTSLPSLISPSVSSPRLVTTMTSSMLTSTPKESVGASKVYGSLSRLVPLSSYASASKLTSPRTVSSTPSSSLSTFSKSMSAITSVASPSRSIFSPLGSVSSAFPSVSSFKPSPVSSKSVSPKVSYPSYPSLGYPSSPSSGYPSLSPSSYVSSSMPSISLTSLTTTLKNPRLPTEEFKRSKRRFGGGEWFKRTHPILEPKQVFSQFWGGSLSKSNLKTWKVGVHKTKRSSKSMVHEPVVEERLQIFTPGREYSYDSGWVTKSTRRSRKK